MCAVRQASTNVRPIWLLNGHDRTIASMLGALGFLIDSLRQSLSLSSRKLVSLLTVEEIALTRPELLPMAAVATRMRCV